MSTQSNIINSHNTTALIKNGDEYFLQVRSLKDISKLLCYLNSIKKFRTYEISNDKFVQNIYTTGGEVKYNNLAQVRYLMTDYITVITIEIQNNENFAQAINNFINSEKQEY